MVKRIVCTIKDFEAQEDGLHIKMRIVAFDSDFGVAVGEKDAIIQPDNPLLTILTIIKQTCVAFGNEQMPNANFTVLNAFIPSYTN